MENSPSKIIFGHEIFICQPIFGHEIFIYQPIFKNICYIFYNKASTKYQLQNIQPFSNLVVHNILSAYFNAP